jgi:hypothetical protein
MRERSVARWGGLGVHDVLTENLPSAYAWRSATVVEQTECDERIRGT